MKNITKRKVELLLRLIERNIFLYSNSNLQNYLYFNKYVLSILWITEYTTFQFLLEWMYFTLISLFKVETRKERTIYLFNKLDTLCIKYPKQTIGFLEGLVIVLGKYDIYKRYVAKTI